MKVLPNETPSYTLLTSYDYIQDFINEGEKATKQIWVEAMYAYPGKVFSILFPMLVRAKKRGVDVRCSFDYLMLLTSRGKELGVKEHVVEALKKENISLTITNSPNLLERICYFIGRNHIKMTIVDSIGYIGGINIGDRNVDAIDFMIKIKHGKVLKQLMRIFENVQKKKLPKDEEIGIDDDTMLLVDSGKPGMSIIYEHAVAMITEAKKSVYVLSQLLPEGKILFALATARKRGVDIKVITPVKNKFSTVFVYLNKLNLFLISGMGMNIPIYFYPSMVHAKLLIIDEEKVCFGSHNFSSYGVWAGTEEIAIKTKDRSLVKDLVRYFEKLLQNTVSS